MIQQLPTGNFTLLKILVKHLRNVASHSQKNLMTVSNLGICFAPTLMRGPEENALSIMEIKYSNVVASTLIEEYDSIFNDPRLSQLQHSYQSLPPPPPQIPQATQAYATNTSYVNNNHDDHFGLGLPSLPPYNSNQLNSFIYYPMGAKQLPYRSNQVITLYACVGDTESELSFGPNEIITDGK